LRSKNPAGEVLKPVRKIHGTRPLNDGVFHDSRV
jgi:hypothetical protein